MSVSKWHDLLEWKCDRNGERIKPTSAHANITIILEHDERLSGLLDYDELTDTPTLTRPPPWAPATDKRRYPCAVCDEDGVRFGAWLLEHYRTGWNSKNALMDALITEAKAHGFDPLGDYLRRLEWDGIERIDTWLTNYLGVRDSEYTRAVGSMWLISGAARGLSPHETKVDTVLILEGLEGKGKSTALKTLGGQWFRDEALDLKDSQETGIALQGVWIWEIAEFAGLKGQAWERTKAFLTRQVDHYRPKYGRTTVSRPRRCIFAASTNDREYIQDERGARRFWPVSCAEVQPIDLEGLQRDRDLLWAEAVVRFKRGDRWWFGDNEELVQEAKEQIAARREEDPWASSVLPFLHDATAPVSSTEVLAHVGVPPEQMNTALNRRACALLRQADYEMSHRPMLKDEWGNVTGKKGAWLWKRREPKTSGYVRRLRVVRMSENQLAFRWERKAEQLPLPLAA